MADKSAVGKTGKPFKMHVDWSKVREFARAIKDPNPLYFDPELAKKEVGGVPVPVTFLQTSAFWTDETSSPASAASICAEFCMASRSSSSSSRSSSAIP